MPIRSLNGKTPKIHPDAFISEFAYVVGDVEIGAFTSVWPGSVIRGESHIVIGSGCCIQDNTTIHADGGGAKIGDNVVMGHGVMCHALSIGDGATLANGCVVNNDAVIGAYSVVASGAVVLDRAEVPSEVFVVGMPAQVKGQVTEAHKARFARTAEHYVELGQMHKKAGLDDRDVNVPKAMP